MKLDILPFENLAKSKGLLKSALLNKGIVGISGVPGYVEKCEAYIGTARRFSALSLETKNKYTPDRDAGVTEGFELGAEKFKDDNGEWQLDDKKASFYAKIPDDSRNKWPIEVDLRKDYVAIADLMLSTGKKILSTIGITDSLGLAPDSICGYGRMLHYQKESDTHTKNPNWCGGHYDHGLFTALMPAYYFKDGKEVSEPDDAGLYAIPTGKTEYEKVGSPEKSVLLFQVGEFGQLMSNDGIRATKHLVRKSASNVERFTLALFIDTQLDTAIRSTSVLTKDSRYADNAMADSSITYEAWETASYERYRATS